MENRGVKFLGLGMIAFAILCYFFYWAIGIKFDYEQMVHVPFFLVPISWISLVSGSIITALAFTVNHESNSRSFQKPVALSPNET